MIISSISFGAQNNKPFKKTLKNRVLQEELNKDLFSALYRNDFKKSERLIKIGAQVNAMNRDTPIFFEVIRYRNEYSGNHSQNEYKLNPKIKFKDREDYISRKETPNTLKMINLVFKSGANFSLLEFLGSTIFDQAVQNGHLNATKRIYELGGRPSDPKEIALDSAAQGNLEILKYLFSIGYDLQSKDIALLAALRAGNNEIAKYLLSVGANPNYKLTKDAVKERHLSRAIYDKGYKTPLTLAISTGNNEMIDLLLEVGAKVEISDENETPIMLAAENVMVLPSVVSRLASSTKDINASRDGKTALNFAFDRDDSVWESDGGECGTEFPRYNEVLSKRSQDVILLLLKSGITFEKEWLKERIAEKRWNREIFEKYLNSSKI